jgi:hypothetical protein
MAGRTVGCRIPRINISVNFIQNFTSLCWGFYYLFEWERNYTIIIKVVEIAR